MATRSDTKLTLGIVVILALFVVGAVVALPAVSKEVAAGFIKLVSVLG